jgi:hypothetical protein
MTWPFVGRGEELARIRALAAGRNSRGVLIVGPTGIGKTRLMTEALATLGADFAVVRSAASCAARELPFGAFAHMLPTAPAPSRRERPRIEAAGLHRAPEPPAEGARPAAGREPGGLLGWAAEAITASAGGRRLVLAVDDAHLLDPASAELVRQVAGTPGCFLVMSAPHLTEPPSWWARATDVRMDLAPLTIRAVRQILRTVHEPPPAEDRLLALHRRSGGNPLHLRELLIAGEEHDAPGPAALVRARLEGLADGVLGVLELLAFGEPVGVGVMGALVEPGVLAAAGESGLVELLDEGRRSYVRLAHPLYGEVLREVTAPERAAERRRQLAGAVQSLGAKRRQDPLRMAVWRLDSGNPGPPGPLVTACRLAWAAHDYPLAIRLGEAAVAAGGGVSAAVALANVLMNVNRHAEGEAVLVAVWDKALDERERVLLTSVRAGLLFAMDEVADAGRLLEETERTLRDPALRQQLRVARGNLVTLAGRCRSGRAIMEGLLAEPGLCPSVAAQARTFRALALAHSGRGHDALAEADAVAAAPSAWRDVVPFLDPLLALTRYAAFLHLGDLAGAERVVAEVRGRGDLDRWPPAAMIFQAAEAGLARLRGRIGEARRIAATPAGASPEDVRLRMPCLAERAHAAALAGDLAAARAALAEADREEAAFFGLLRHGMDLARAWTVAKAGDGGGRAVELALLAASRARVESLYGLELVALHDVVRLGAPGEAADRLEELRAHVDGELPPLFAAHARALLDRDEQALAEVARAFDGLGLHHYATEITESLDPGAAPGAGQASRKARLTSSATRTP